MWDPFFVFSYKLYQIFSVLFVFTQFIIHLTKKRLHADQPYYRLGFKNSKLSTKTIVTNPNKFNNTVNTLH